MSVNSVTLSLSETLDFSTGEVAVAWRGGLAAVEVDTTEDEGVGGVIPERGGGNLYHVLYQQE